MKFDEWLAWEKQDAIEETWHDAIFELLEEFEDIPEELRQRIEEEDSPETLKKWHKLAAKATNIQDFQEKIQ